MNTSQCRPLMVRRRRPSSHEADRGSKHLHLLSNNNLLVLVYDFGDATVKHMMLWKDDDVVDYKTQNTHR